MFCFSVEPLQREQWICILRMKLELKFQLGAVLSHCTVLLAPSGQGRRKVWFQVGVPTVAERDLYMHSQGRVEGRRQGLGLKSGDDVFRGNTRASGVIHSPGGHEPLSEKNVSYV